MHMQRSKIYNNTADCSSHSNLYLFFYYFFDWLYVCKYVEFWHSVVHTPHTSMIEIRFHQFWIWLSRKFCIAVSVCVTNAIESGQRKKSDTIFISTQLLFKLFNLVLTIAWQNQADHFIKHERQFFSLLRI